MPEPQEVGPPNIDDLLQPRFATSLENRIGADAGIDGYQIDTIRGAGHRSHLHGKWHQRMAPRRNAGDLLLVGPIVRLDADAKAAQPRLTDVEASRALASWSRMARQICPLDANSGERAESSTTGGLPKKQRQRRAPVGGEEA
jgi:hypothetical protein